ncbi:MAG TPA: tetratricopeptide repeat protein [Tepidisphaeraceae bacterium]|jgi:tetratricopeptide (TPR) repeat protein|nr:tetratricopeptide repeat protein [Tepidisphaeraceae bacterium]
MNIRPKTVRRLVILLAACGVIAAAVASILSYTRHSQENLIQATRTDGMNAYNSGDYATAFEKLHFFISKHHDDYDAKFAEAVSRNHVETANGQYLKEAKELFEELHSERPDDIRVSHNLLRLYNQIGYATEGTHLADEVLAHDPNDVEALRTKSAALWQINKLSDAIAVSEKLNDVAPLDLNGQIQTYNLLCLQKRPAAEIVARFQALQQAHPDDPRFEMLLGLAYSNAGDGPNTLKWLRSAAQRTPPDAEFVRLLSRYFDNLKLFDESRQLLERAVAGGNQPEIVKVLIERLWENGHFAEVTDRLKDLDAGAESSDVDLLAFKALSLEELGKRSDEDAIVQKMKQRAHNNKAAAWALAIGTRDDPNIAQRDAIKQYESALARDHDNAIIRCWIGESYSRLGEMELATQQWRQAAELMPSWAHPCVLLAREALSRDRGDDALRNAAEAIHRAPNVLESGVVMALASYQRMGPSASQSSVEGLITFIQEIQKQAPDEHQTLPLLADLQARDGKRDDAIETIHAALNKPDEKTDTDLVLRLAEVNRRDNLGLDRDIAAALPTDLSTSPRLALEEAMNLARQGKKEDGLNLLNKAAASATSQPVKWKLARAQYLESINDPAAKAAWIELGDSNPDDTAIQTMLLTIAHSASADRDFFKRTIDRVHNLTGDDALGWKLANARYLLTSEDKQRDSAAAVVILKSLVDSSPDTPEYRVLLAAGLMNLGNTSGAIEHLKAAVDHDPAGVSIMIELAKHLLSQGRSDEARNYLDRAVKSPGLTPANRTPLAILLARQGAIQQAIDLLQPVSDSLDAGGQLLLAELSRKQGQSSQAETIYTSLLNHPPVSADAIASAADFYASTNRLDQAKQILSRLSDPNYSPVQRSLLTARFDETYVSKETAHQELLNATNQSPGDPAAWKGLIEFSIRQNDFDDAIAAADNALAKLPNNGDLKQLKTEAAAMKSTNADQSNLQPLIDALSNDPHNAAEVERLKALQDARQNKLSPEQMVAKLKSIADKYPSYYPLQAQLAQAYLSLGQTSNASTVVERLMDNRPNDPDAAKLAVNVYRTAQRWREMKRAAGQWRARTLDKPMDADIAQAEASLAMGDVKSAADILSPYLQTAKDQPQHLPALTAIVARWLIAADRIPEAKAMLEPLLAQGQAWRRMWLMMASKYVSPAAIATEWIRTAAAAIPDNSIDERFIVAQSWHQMGMRLNDKDAMGLARDLLQGMVDRSEAGAQPAMILASLDTEAGDLAAAESLYRKAVKLDPHLPDALNNLAYILLERGEDLNEAKDLVSRAIATQPNTAAFHDTLARIDEKLDNRDQSLAEFQEALRLDPANLAAHIGLTRVLSTGGHRDKAQQELQRIDSQLKGTPPTNESTRKELETLRASLSSSGTAD